MALTLSPADPNPSTAYTCQPFGLAFPVVPVSVPLSVPAEVPVR